MQAGRDIPVDNVRTMHDVDRDSNQCTYRSLLNKYTLRVVLPNARPIHTLRRDCVGQTKPNCSSMKSIRQALERRQRQFAVRDVSDFRADDMIHPTFQDDYIQH